MNTNVLIVITVSCSTVGKHWTVYFTHKVYCSIVIVCKFYNVRHCNQRYNIILYVINCTIISSFSLYIYIYIYNAVKSDVLIKYGHNYNKKVNKLPHSIIFTSHFYIVASPSKKWIETRPIKNMHIYIGRDIKTK